MLSRRAFLAGSSALTIAGSPIEVRAQGGGMRRSVRGMSLDDADLAAYARAVAAMKALPASDPRNWNRFADIHRNFCPHGNWYFLPWHRAYLASFERVVRDRGEVEARARRHAEQPRVRQTTKRQKAKKKMSSDQDRWAKVKARLRVELHCNVACHCVMVCSGGWKNDGKQEEYDYRPQ